MSGSGFPDYRFRSKRVGPTALVPQCTTAFAAVPLKMSPVMSTGTDSSTEDSVAALRSRGHDGASHPLSRVIQHDNEAYEFA